MPVVIDLPACVRYNKDKHDLAETLFHPEPRVEDNLFRD